MGSDIIGINANEKSQNGPEIVFSRLTGLLLAINIELHFPVVPLFLNLSITLI